MGPGQFLQSPYNPQFPNPLLAAETIVGPGYFTRPPSEAQFFSLQDGGSAGDVLGNFGNLSANHPLNVHPGVAMTQPLNNHWEFDMLDDEASLPDSDDDLPDVRGNLPPIKNLVPEHWTVSPVDLSLFSAFAQSNDVQAHMETPYSAEFWASGLNTIFMHFINVTGPGISIFEGDISSPLDRSKIKATAGSGKSLWSCKLNPTYRKYDGKPSDISSRCNSLAGASTSRPVSRNARTGKPPTRKAPRQPSHGGIEALSPCNTPHSEKREVAFQEDAAGNSCCHSLAQLLRGLVV
ncbi:hypothetical protein THARTR1_07195 [Trichoderma harzianum]|uniref:Uncharacterized protein n=1 Tax=Trichoderma harzianum TaxID=5544 RepID=A0A2K0U2I2_TRIHA|nr:hypothetical protein THARTR1_07195 [Trichoderma harzianum]